MSRFFKVCGFLGWCAIVISYCAFVATYFQAEELPSGATQRRRLGRACPAILRDAPSVLQLFGPAPARPGAAPAGFGEATFEGRSWWNVGDADTRKWFGLNPSKTARAAEQLARLGTSHFEYLKPAAGATFERCYGTTDAACALHATLEGLAFVAWGGVSVDITTGTTKEQYTSAVGSVLRTPPMACNAAMPAERRTAVMTSVASWWGAEEGAALTAVGVEQRKRAWKASASLRKRKRTSPTPPPPLGLTGSPTSSPTTRRPTLTPEHSAMYEFSERIRELELPDGVDDVESRAGLLAMVGEVFDFWRGGRYTKVHLCAGKQNCAGALKQKKWASGTDETKMKRAPLSHSIRSLFASLLLAPLCIYFILIFFSLISLLCVCCHIYLSILTVFPGSR